MSLKIGINGFGRIGRNTFRALREKGDVEVVAINDLTDPETLAMLLKRDSVFGTFPGSVEAAANAIMVDGRRIDILSVRNPEELPWRDKGVDLVLECTGLFTTRAKAGMHLTAGAGRVIISAPAKDEVDATIVLGVNDGVLRSDMQVISNASCTTNCLAPVAKVLHDTFGIRRGLMTTVHAYTNDQNIQDLPHKDARRARAAAVNIIPTTTGAAKAVGLVIPELNGKLNGMAMRVPVTDGSVVDLVAELDREASRGDINQAMQEASQGDLKDILEYSEDPLVSTDIIGNPASSIFDGLSTLTLDGNFVKVVSWYDNEWGYSNRLADVCVKFGNL